MTWHAPLVNVAPAAASGDSSVQCSISVAAGFGSLTGIPDVELRRAGRNVQRDRSGDRPAEVGQGHAGDDRQWRRAGQHRREAHRAEPRGPIEIPARRGLRAADLRQHRRREAGHRAAGDDRSPRELEHTTGGGLLTARHGERRRHLDVATGADPVDPGLQRPLAELGEHLVAARADVGRLDRLADRLADLIGLGALGAVGRGDELVAIADRHDRDPAAAGDEERAALGRGQADIRERDVRLAERLRELGAQHRADRRHLRSRREQGPDVEPGVLRHRDRARRGDDAHRGTLRRHRPQRVGVRGRGRRAWAGPGGRLRLLLARPGGEARGDDDDDQLGSAHELLVPRGRARGRRGRGKPRPWQTSAVTPRSGRPARRASPGCTATSSASTSRTPRRSRARSSPTAA